MELLHSDTGLFKKIRTFISSASNFVLFSPYIKEMILSQLFKDIAISENNTIITTWRPQDIAFGVSDIEVYPLCKEKGVTLLLNNRVHLKSYIIDNFKTCIITSSNITDRGLAVSPNFNFELGVVVEGLNIEDKIYFDKIIEQSEEITQSYYEQVKEQVEKLDLQKDMPDNFEIKKDPSDKEFLFTALPMSDDIELLFDIYNGNRNYDEETLRSAEHDIRIYKIPLGYSEQEFRKILKEKYFNHPFIEKFLEFIGDGKYFGEATEWLHNNCTTVPTPRRYEIKSALQRIYKFTESLSEGEYIVEVPKKYSETLRKVL